MNGSLATRPVARQRSLMRTRVDSTERLISPRAPEMSGRAWE